MNTSGTDQKWLCRAAGILLACILQGMPVLCAADTVSVVSRGYLEKS